MGSLHFHRADQAVDHRGFRGQLTEDFAHLWHILDSIGGGDHPAYTNQKPYFYLQPDLRLIVLIDVSRRRIKLLLAHRDVAGDEHSFPRYLDFVEVKDGI